MVALKANVDVMVSVVVGHLMCLFISFKKEKHFAEKTTKTIRMPCGGAFSGSRVRLARIGSVSATAHACYSARLILYGQGSPPRGACRQSCGCELHLFFFPCLRPTTRRVLSGLCGCVAHASSFPSLLLSSLVVLQAPSSSLQSVTTAVRCVCA